MVRHSGKNSSRKLTLLFKPDGSKRQKGDHGTSKFCGPRRGGTHKELQLDADRIRSIRKLGVWWWMISIPTSLSFYLIISCWCLPLAKANRKLWRVGGGGGKEICMRQNTQFSFLGHEQDRGGTGKLQWACGKKSAQGISTTLTTAQGSTLGD